MLINSVSLQLPSLLMRRAAILDFEVRVVEVISVIFQVGNQTSEALQLKFSDWEITASSNSVMAFGFPTSRFSVAPSGHTYGTFPRAPLLLICHEYPQTTAVSGLSSQILLQTRPSESKVVGNTWKREHGVLCFDR